MTVLCLVEWDAAGAADASLRALTFGRRLAVSASVPLAAVLFAAPDAGEVSAAALSAVRTWGAAEIYAVSAAGLAGYGPAAWGSALAQLVRSVPATAVIAAATDRGSEVLAQLGAVTGLPVAACCTAASAAGPGRWQLTRQRWAGSLLEDAELTAATAILTVAADAVQAEPADSLAEGSVHDIVAELADSDLRVQAAESAVRGGGVSLATARVVVGGGRGVGGPDGFAVLEELAGLLGGAVGVSRVVTSQGWRPHQQQVGQTGTKISPELYVACGISGAIQHMAGCQSARHIVVVNTDPDAPIMSRADYAVIGDVHEVLPALITAIRERTGRQ
jgi:electron transfer flavoprotein alpha subunit